MAALVVSISGIRGIVGDGLDPQVLVRFVAAYAAWCRGKAGSPQGTRALRPAVVVGRDARVSGPILAEITMSTLQAAGLDVIDAGLATTPTVEMAVIRERAAGGIILSASHNPAEWNALKLLGPSGEFLTPAEAEDVIARAAVGSDAAAAAAATDAGGGDATPPPAPWAAWNALGSRAQRDYLDMHIDAILALPEIDSEGIRTRGFRVVVDGVNSVGGIAIPALLRRLGVSPDNIIEVNCDPTGVFAHPAEPLPENLVTTCQVVEREGADLGIVVDPDADRLALIEDGGRYMSEELTQVLAADFWWRHHSGPFVTNLSSSRAIEDVAARHGQEVYRSAVGEINVVEEMKRRGAVLGGEGNGGVILPALHYGRDALVGVAFTLQHLATEGARLSELRARMPAYHIVKMKTEIGDRNADALLEQMARRYSGARVSTVDGVKVDLDEGWVHLRKSNTEPIVRVYAEAASKDIATALGERFMNELLDG